ncbi:carbohydrate-binding module family 18 protein [Piromyces sp. E2]|nr:carbohydrate-binding module family 18 protein [Piromyces sp. E2]|eukprot:OUM63688.1 carbohydrate-binding module family 18 protein [Piromyces sp. E2]
MKFNIQTVLSLVLSACVGIKADLTQDEKKTLLELHRNARKVLNAPDMKEIYWDDTMAAGAQKYSNLCKGMVHSDTSEGENLAGNSVHDVTRMFNQWMKEKEAFDESGYRAKFKGVSYDGKVVGHYSQIVWATNTKIGCGLTYCSNLSYHNLLVCRYETGNILKRQVYAEPTKTTTKKTTTTTKKKTTTTTKKTTTTTKKTTTTTKKRPLLPLKRRLLQQPKRLLQQKRPPLLLKRLLQLCGAKYGNAKCPTGQCCSYKGYCGTTKSFCAIANNCQPKYGICKDIKM